MSWYKMILLYVMVLNDLQFSRFAFLVMDSIIFSSGTVMHLRYIRLGCSCTILFLGFLFISLYVIKICHFHLQYNVVTAKDSVFPSQMQQRFCFSFADRHGKSSFLWLLTDDNTVTVMKYILPRH